MKFAFLMYHGVEPIDLAAIGVISMARRVMPELSCLTVAATLDLQIFSNGLRVAPDVTFAQCPVVDMIIVPGGPGWVQAAEDAAVLDFLRTRSPATPVVSVCTGAMIMAAAGLLDGLSATTKCEVVAPEVSPLRLLSERYPKIDPVHALLVDSGAVVTGGGVSLCIDTMLHVLATRVDADKTAEVIRILEYAGAARANRSRLKVVIGGS